MINPLTLGDLRKALQKLPEELDKLHVFVRTRHKIDEEHVAYLDAPLGLIAHNKEDSPEEILLADVDITEEMLKDEILEGLEEIE